MCANSSKNKRKAKRGADSDDELSAADEEEEEEDEEDTRPPENDGGALLSEFQRIVATPSVTTGPAGVSSAAAGPSAATMGLDDILSSMSRPGALSPNSALRNSAAAVGPSASTSSAASTGASSAAASSVATTAAASAALLRTSRDFPQTSPSSSSSQLHQPSSGAPMQVGGGIGSINPLSSSLNNSGEKLPAVITAEKTVQVWKGGLRFDDKFICDVTAYVKMSSSSQKPLITWPDPLPAVRSVLPPSLPPPQVCTVVSLLPEKDLASYNHLLATLDKNLWVAEAKLRSSHVFLMSSTQLPHGYTVPLAQKAASLVAINIPISNTAAPTAANAAAAGMLKPSAVGMSQQAQAQTASLQAPPPPPQVSPGGQMPQSTTMFTGAVFTPNVSAGPPGPWLKQQSFALVGYRKEELDRMRTLIQYLVSSSGVHRPLPAPDVNIIVVCAGVYYLYVPEFIIFMCGVITFSFPFLSLSPSLVLFIFFHKSRAQYTKY